MRVVALPTLLAALTLVHSSPTTNLQRPLSLGSSASSSSDPTTGNDQPLPLLIWHGLGDQFNNDGLRDTGALAAAVHKNIYVYYIHLDEDGGKDRTATYFGNLNDQIAQVCLDLQEDDELGKDKYKDEFGKIRLDGLGFSQGGQFLRGLLERCDALSMRTLMTFGSQHNGISEFQRCGDFDFLCKGAVQLAKSNAWTDYVQTHIVPAQYYRTADDDTGLGSDEYLQHSNFLADVNNEREQKNATYAERIASLENFVMYIFDGDTVVIPKESSWFAELNSTSGEVTPLRDRPLYVQDWLGLRKLDERGGLFFKNTSGSHMELNAHTLKEAFGTYFGPERKAVGINKGR